MLFVYGSEITIDALTLLSSYVPIILVSVRNREVRRQKVRNPNNGVSSTIAAKGQTMNSNKPPKGFTVERFGWLKRRWQKNDHLVVIGYNHVTDRYFTLVKRQVREILAAADLPFRNRHSPQMRAEVATNVLGISTKPTFHYEGSLKVSKTAVLHRHFVFVELYEVPDGVEPKGYYVEFDEGKIDSHFGHYELDVAKYIINKAKLVGSSLEVPEPTARVA